MTNPKDLKQVKEVLELLRGNGMPFANDIKEALTQALTIIELWENSKSMERRLIIQLQAENATLKEALEKILKCIFAVEMRDIAKYVLGKTEVK